MGNRFQTPIGLHYLATPHHQSSLIPQGCLPSSLCRQRPIEPAAPVHVLSSSALLLDLDRSSIRALVVNVLPLQKTPLVGGRIVQEKVCTGLLAQSATCVVSKPKGMPMACIICISSGVMSASRPIGAASALSGEISVCFARFAESSAEPPSLQTRPFCLGP